MPNSIVIKVNHLTKVYKLYDKPMDRLKESLHPLNKQYHKEFYALNDISFEIKKGETVGIIGKNGAGKSTLLKIITGILTPTRGSVHVNGRIASLLELGAGFNPEYTGIENIYFQCSLMGYTQDEIENKIEDIIQFADIGDFIHQPVKMYSSGMFARLAFAVNINVDPHILIVDEALAVGDMNFQAKCMTAMDRIKQKGTTILFVSHDIGSVKSLCEKGIYIKNGILHSLGKASDVAELYIREMREDLNEEHKKFTRASQVVMKAEKPKDILESETVEFKHSEAFDKRVAQFRYGSGGAKITCVELLDDNGEPVIEAAFNQEVKLRIFCESYRDALLSINYYILDDKKIYLFGGGPRTFGHELLTVSNGSQYVLEYTFKLPLVEGAYSVTLECNQPIILNQNVEFLDVIENAIVFKVNEKPESKLWAKMYIENKLEVFQI